MAQQMSPYARKVFEDVAVVLQAAWQGVEERRDAAEVVVPFNGEDVVVTITSREPES